MPNLYFKLTRNAQKPAIIGEMAKMCWWRNLLAENI